MQSSLESIIMFSLCEVYRDGGYIQMVEDCAKESMAKESMAKAAEEVKALPHYAQDGEVGLFMFISCNGKYKFFLLSG